MWGMRNVGVASDRPAGGEGERVDRPQRDAERHAAGCAPAPAAHLVWLPAIRSIGPALPGGGGKGGTGGARNLHTKAACACIGGRGCHRRVPLFGRHTKLCLPPRFVGSGCSLATGGRLRMTTPPTPHPQARRSWTLPSRRRRSASWTCGAGWPRCGRALPGVDWVADGANLLQPLVTDV